MNYLKLLFSALILCFAIVCQSQNQQEFTGLWEGMPVFDDLSEAEQAAAAQLFLGQLELALLDDGTANMFMGGRKATGTYRFDAAKKAVLVKIDGQEVAMKTADGSLFMQLEEQKFRFKKSDRSTDDIGKRADQQFGDYMEAESVNLHASWELVGTESAKGGGMAFSEFVHFGENGQYETTGPASTGTYSRQDEQLALTPKAGETKKLIIKKLELGELWLKDPQSGNLFKFKKSYE